MSQAVNFTTPVGRLVSGSLSEPQTTDAEGKPLVVKSGPNAGQPRVDFYFALAIPKGAEQHWAYTEWGQTIYQAGAAAFPQAHQSQKFAWKVQDGDSQIPNSKGKRNCDRPGYPGHWIVSFSSGYTPNVYSQNGTAFTQITDLKSVKLGYYVQVQGNVQGNGSQQQPGVFLNHRMICLRGYGEEIVVGPDVASAGFGAAPLPAGASAVPLAGQMPPAAPGAFPPPGAPGAPGAAPGAFPPPGAPGAAPAPFVPPQAAAAPLVPMPGATPGAFPPPAAAPALVPAVPQLVQVPGAPYTIEQCRASGWTDDQIVAQGVATRAPAAAPAPMLPPPAAAPAPLPQGISAPAPGAPGAPIAPAGLVPNPAFAHIPAPGAPAAPIAPAAPAAGPQLTPAGVAAGGTYASFRAQGWTDDVLRQYGYIA